MAKTQYKVTVLKWTEDQGFTYKNKLQHLLNVGILQSGYSQIIKNTRLLIKVSHKWIQNSHNAQNNNKKIRKTCLIGLKSVCVTMKHGMMKQSGETLFSASDSRCHTEMLLLVKFASLELKS